MSSKDAEVLSDSETDPVAEVSAHVYRSPRAEPQFALPTAADDALLDHHVEEALASLDDLARLQHEARAEPAARCRNAAHGPR
jgi:hypothetical protein